MKATRLVPITIKVAPRTKAELKRLAKKEVSLWGCVSPSALANRILVERLFPKELREIAETGYLKIQDFGAVKDTIKPMLFGVGAKRLKGE